MEGHEHEGTVGCDDAEDQHGAMTSAEIRAEREELCPPGTERRALDERMLTDDGFIDDDAAEEIEREICERFGASPEASALAESDPQGICPVFVLRICRMARNTVLTRLTPDDVKAALLEEIPFAWTYVRPGLARPFVESVRAFFEFVARTLELPRAKACAEALDSSLVVAFGDALERYAKRRWRDSGKEVVETRESDVVRQPLKRTERNRRKARRRAQKASRRKNR